jgi:hypothetical protein
MINDVIGAAALLLVDLVVTDHHRPRLPSLVQNEISLGKKYCPIVNAARAAGLTDDQIVAIAVVRGVSPKMIIWARKNCVVATEPRSSLEQAQT